MSRRSRSTSWSFNGAVIGICVAGIALIIGSIIGRSVLFAAPYNAQTNSKYKSKLASLQKELNSLQTAAKPDAAKIKAQQELVNELVSDSHWHSAYGIYECDAYLGKVTDNGDGTKTVQGAIDGTSFPDTAGVHAHDDGLIHIHPFVDKAAGNKARLGIFLDAVKMTVSDKKIVFPANGEGVQKTTLDVAKKKCKGKTAEISVLVWSSATDDAPQRYTGDFRKVPLLEDAAYAFVFAPKDTIVPIPGSIATLASPADVAPLPGTTDTTVAGSTVSTIVTTGSTPVTVIVGGSTTVPGASTTKAAATTLAGASTTNAAATTLAGASTTKVTATTLAGSTTTAG